MLDKIFNKFIALLLVAMGTYLAFIFFVASPKIQNFFYETEIESIGNQIDKLNTIIMSKSMDMKSYAQTSVNQDEIKREKIEAENNLKDLIAQIKVLDTGIMYIVHNGKIILNKDKVSKEFYSQKDFFSKLKNANESQNIITYTSQGKKKVSLVKHDDYFNWYLVLTIDELDLYKKANTLNNLIWNVTVVIVFIVFIVGFILAKRVLNPINELSQNALKVQEGDFKVRNSVTSRDELGILAKQFNFMLDKIEDNIKNLEEKVDLRTQEISQQLYNDDITHLKNRYALLENIKDNSARTIVLVDINSFNDINELYGYKVGNEVLIKFATFIENIAKNNEAEAYKIYGNVFAIMFNDSMFIFNKFEEFVNNLLESTKKESFTVDVLDIKIFLDITLGIAICQKQGLKKANIALQKAKKKHKTYVVYNSEIDRKQIIQDTIFWRNKIEDAIENDKIIPFAQGIVDDSQEIIKYEMLMRMEDVDEEGNQIFISPFKFLDISVKTKQYLTLSNIMIDKSLDLLNKTDKLLSINVSFLDIDDYNFINFLDEKIATIDKKDYSRIVFEILESDNITNYEIFEEFIEKYRKKGIKIAIDDFGTGYSNFSHIMKIRPDYLKIDASLIKDIDTSKDSYELVKSIVAFSKELNMKTIAEFVHNKEVFELALGLGIEEFQGYYFSKPEKDFK